MTGWEMLEELSKLADQNCYELDKPLHVLYNSPNGTYCFIPTQILISKDKISGNSGIFIE